MPLYIGIRIIFGDVPEVVLFALDFLGTVFPLIRCDICVRLISMSSQDGMAVLGSARRSLLSYSSNGIQVGVSRSRRPIRNVHVLAASSRQDPQPQPSNLVEKLRGGFGEG